MSCLKAVCKKIFLQILDQVLEIKYVDASYIDMKNDLYMIISVPDGFIFVINMFLNFDFNNIGKGKIELAD